MKKILSGLIALVSIFSQAQAQYRPQAGAKSMTFGVNGLQFINFNTNASRTGTLLFRQYIAENKAIRASANLRINSTNTALEDTTNGVEQSSANRNMMFSIAGGLQKSLGSRPRLEPYIGIDLIMGFSSSRNKSRTEVTNANKTFANDQNGDYNQVTVTTSTPFNFGVAPLIGFNYYIADGIALGGEFSYNLNMAFGSKGKTVTEKRENGTDLAKQEVVNSPSSINYSLGNTGVSNITFTIFF